MHNSDTWMMAVSFHFIQKCNIKKLSLYDFVKVPQIKMTEHSTSMLSSFLMCTHQRYLLYYMLYICSLVH